MNYFMWKRKRDYENFNLLCDKLDRYGYEQSPENEKDLYWLASVLSHQGFPLPSGRYGNVLAVALEMYMYVGASYFIQNAEQLEIDLESVSSECGGSDIWDAQQTLEFSKSYFDDQKISEDYEIYQKYPEDRRYHNDQVDVFLEVTALLKSKPKTMKK